MEVVFLLASSRKYALFQASGSIYERKGISGRRFGCKGKPYSPSWLVWYLAIGSPRYAAQQDHDRRPNLICPLRRAADSCPVAPLILLAPDCGCENNRSASGTDCNGAGRGMPDAQSRQTFGARLPGRQDIRTQYNPEGCACAGPTPTPLRGSRRSEVLRGRGLREPKAANQTLRAFHFSSHSMS